MARNLLHPVRAVPSERRTWGMGRHAPLGGSLVAAAGLGLMVYLATTSLPYFAQTPTTDGRFGGLNACVQDALRERALGFAVGHGASAVAAFGGARLVLCVAAPPASFRARVLAWPGVQAVTFDGLGALWFTAEGSATLWRWGPEPSSSPVKLGELPVLALVGHASGVMVLEHSGRLVSLSGSGEVQGQLELWAEVASAAGPQLWASQDGQRVALLTQGGVVVVRARDAALLRAEAPCDVEHLWWLEAPSRMQLVCGPEASWSLFWDVDGGGQEAAPAPTRHRALHVPLSTAWVEPCEGLPCSVPGPSVSGT